MVRTLKTKKAKNKETQTENKNKPIVVSGNYYWVKSFKLDKEFEPAKCRDRHNNGNLYFCFTNGGIIEVNRAYDYKDLPKLEI